MKKIMIMLAAMLIIGGTTAFAQAKKAVVPPNNDAPDVVTIHHSKPMIENRVTAKPVTDTAQKPATHVNKPILEGNR